MEYNLVGAIELGSWMLALLINTGSVVLPHILKDCLDDLVVLFFWSSMVGPCQILELRNYASLAHLPLGVHDLQLHLSLDEIWH